ncbi:GNAT family N-acetyltransferase [Lipingzhangella sp. LS1_29]|uniref:GNAT family N-acetyltransferase n=1 Tax=Lipingzhangella rawalii TaxID=2055835 RepID=A0ABU2H1J0_9ACTN|nr:GNAT family N-acetyltransferase [Lipingzhangella rawalii]MDS1269163.1 GNAT family N-acetyltransferase [Lipingzhangella rawalii]
MTISPTMNPSVSGMLRFRYLRASEVDELAELWQGLHRHHVASTPHLDDLISPVNDDESWQRRRRHYAAWLAEPDTLAILAERDGTKLGYAMVTVQQDRRGSWNRGERVATLQTLTVAPEHRRQGVGSALLEEVRRQLGASGISDLELAAVSGNEEAMRFYEREGFRPFVTTMVTRLGPAAGPHD